MISRQGFTLIELLVVISIVSLISSVVLTSVQTAREKAMKARAEDEINLLVEAIQLASQN
jgi:prepilin-type N-terminal cleavage/methylation domain-containing protein